MSESHGLMRAPQPGQEGYPGNPGFPGFPDYTRYSGATQYEGHSFESNRSSQTEKGPTPRGSMDGRPTKELDWDGEKDPENPMNWALWKKIIHTAIPAIYTFGLYVHDISVAASEIATDINEEQQVSRRLSLVYQELWNNSARQAETSHSFPLHFTQSASFSVLASLPPSPTSTAVSSYTKST